MFLASFEIPCVSDTQSSVQNCVKMEQNVAYNRFSVYNSVLSADVRDFQNLVSLNHQMQQIPLVFLRETEFPFDEMIVCFLRSVFQNSFDGT